ncbi:MAG: hypothetical protein CMJ64_06035 [Planctomycetaceae bacterium]|jgi:GAF domain-containing protein|nr:hypothetical protein [Planctomycetaceae bacterium]
MTATADNLTLEYQVLELINPEPTETDAGFRAARTREAALAMLCRCAQSVDSPSGLLNEAGSLAATALGLDLFAVGESLSEQDGMRVSLATPTTYPEQQETKTGPREDRSAILFAMKAARPIVIADLDSEHRFHDSFLIEHQAQSGIICPVSYASRDYGAIGVFGYANACSRRTMCCSSNP